MRELLPCPFCGGEPLIQEIEPHTHGLTFGDFVMPDYGGSFTIECPTEGCCGMIADTRPEVVAAWNRRPSQAPSAPVAREVVLEKAAASLEGLCYGAENGMGGTVAERLRQAQRIIRALASPQPGDA